MITIKFPALNKALAKDLKDLNEDDPRRGIIVLNNNAIVLRNEFCLVCDLKDYFNLECGIEDDYEIEELEKILFFMDGKIFSNEFWNELTKGSNMEIRNGNLYVENPKYSKDLHHKEISANLIEPLSLLTKIDEQKENAVSCISIPFGALKIIYDCLASEFKLDHIILEFCAQELPIKFTFRKRKHFYGYIMPHYDSAQEGYRFDTLEFFVNSFQEMLLELKEQQKSMAPPPPPLPSVPVDEYKSFDEIANEVKADLE